ncbi:MAG: putative bifunctional diguanylate cyclase/phosphodiesterase [Spirochaetota bacterium]
MANREPIGKQLYRDFRSTAAILRGLLLLASLAAYAAAFSVLYPHVGDAAATIAIFPILLGAHGFGIAGGFLTALCCIAINAVLMDGFGEDALFTSTRVLNMIVLLVLGLASGVIRNLSLRGRRARDLLNTAFEVAQDAVWEHRLDSNETYFSPRWYAMLGYSPGELHEHHQTWVKLLHPEDRDRAMTAIRRAASNGDSDFTVSFRLLEKCGSWKWILARGKVVEKDERGKARRIVGVFSDISSLKHAESEIARLAYYDQLTGLPNRKSFYERADQALAQAHRSHPGQLCAVLLLDLDNFKDVNDTLGHDVGDRLLIEAAARLKERTRRADLLFRFGGDEFTILLTKLQQTTDAAVVANDLIRSFVDPFEIDGHTVYTALSVGIALYPRDGTSIPDLTRKSDTALNASKRDRNTYRFYTFEMQNEAVHKMSIINDLRAAVEEGQFRLHYQPIVDADGYIRGAEALLRWQDSDGEMRPPAEFIPIAEETGLILRIGRWVLSQAAADAQRWRKAGLGDIPVSVNVAPRQLRHHSLMDDLELTLAGTELPAGLLSMELTEGSFVDPSDESARRLRAIQQRGIRISIDDFGTGYSSMSYLKRLPVNTLKIDRSFVMSLPMNTQDVSIVQAVVTMAHGLGLSVVAEGVDAAQQVEFLKSIGCDLFQGYYFSRPIPAEQFEALLAENPGAARIVPSSAGA